VIVNLVVNARDAMPDGGVLEIATRNMDLDLAYAAAHPDAHPGKYVLIAVTDTGVGMDEKTLQSAFEPFFTTKEPGKGTGLGLSTVHGIVKQSCGWIQVRSEVGKGTTFEIFLPRVEAVQEGDAVTQALSDTPRGGETVLVVEDDDGVRELTTGLLATEGYHVLQASNSNDALAIEREHAGPIDLLLTDLVLPGMNGNVLYERMHALRPNMKVIFTSGYTSDVIAKSGLEQHMAYLAKPFDTSSLLAKVRQTLGEGQENAAGFTRPPCA
jgi:CheY-like chemotaxis protein